MSNTNFQTMSQEELRQYILANRDDEDAVHEAVLRVQRDGTDVTVDELIEIVKQKQKSHEQ